MLTTENLRSLIGATLYDNDGDKVGSIGQIYTDDVTGQPSWATVKTGLFGTKETFVPLPGADLRGEDLHVSYSKSQIKDAPHVDTDTHLSEQEEADLYSHYGLREGYDRSSGYDRERDGEFEADRDYREAGGTGRGQADAELVAREEHLVAGTQSREAGRARLRKVVVEDEERVTVPVRREELRVEREPLSGEPAAGGSIGEPGSEEVDITLREERPVVGKETVATERVRVGTETVEDEVEVSETVRKERIEVDETDPRRNDTV